LACSSWCFRSRSRSARHGHQQEKPRYACNRPTRLTYYPPYHCLPHALTKK
jgi:hypothetical protein